MNRETKFGLITGLLLIVGIGMLISRYLSSRTTSPISTPALHRLGSDYRQQLTAPVGTATIPPALAPAGPSAVAASTNQPPLVQQLPGAARASGNTSSGPTITAPVADVRPELVAYKAPITATAGNKVGNAMTSDSSAASAASSAADVAAPSSTNHDRRYAIRRGDTLWRIAMHFYHRADGATMARIIHANPRELSSVRSVLRVGEVLHIPASRSSGAVHLTQMAAITQGPVPIPGVTSPTGHHARRTAHVIRYRVRRGDTLYSIARRVLGAGSRRAVDQIMRENHIRNSRDLRVGRMLRISKPA